jgi:hypothetical protein
MTAMFAVRYASLAVLALLIAAGVNTYPSFEALLEHAYWMVAACGALIVTGLFVMKFVGPPPRAFVARAIIAFAITVTSLYAAYLGEQLVPPTLMTVNLVLGFVLLAWYARE